MRYTMNHENYKTFNTFEVNRLPSRAYFIPFGSLEKLRSTNVRTERADSDKVLLLSGDDWEFKYYEKVSQMPAIFDTETQEMDTITVPSTWQRTGYEPPFYVNSRYQFPAKPPHIPEDISVGVYKKKVEIGDTNKTYILSLLGVAPSADVYVNGEFVGYGEGMHNTSEYDITKYLKQGENELVFVLHKWCNGSYLEAQDMFRENGIFRDVYIYALDHTFMNDFEIKSTKKTVGYDVTVRVWLQGNIDGYSVQALFEDEGKEVVGRKLPAESEMTFTFNDVAFEDWNAEIPKIYELFLTLSKNGAVSESIRNITGFKYIQIDKEVFRFNGRNIKMKGVNHHDTHEKNGYVMRVEDLEKDIKLMKDLNVNTVRCAHYPPDPLLVILCDIHGLYVIDEADIETHGMVAANKGEHTLSNNLEWKEHYWDRVQAMYMRDRNRGSVTMWSLGNEAGGYKCQDVCYERLKEICPEIPVHYEGVCRTKRHAYDVYSKMYDNMAYLQKVKNRARGEKSVGKPYFLCEYAHAMGVGPGSLEDYMQYFYSDDKFLGGCIWEWADHAVLHEEKDAPLRYTYGGDHDEFIHDGNFCVDGLVYPDRTPHTGALAMKAVYRPLRVAKTKDGYRFRNTNSFKDSSDMQIRYEFLQDGVVVAEDTLRLNIVPSGTADVQLDLPKRKRHHDYHITFIYERADGYEIAREQIELQAGKFVLELPTASEGSELTYVADKDKGIIIEFEGGSMEFCTQTGALSSYKVGAKEFINQTPAGTVYGMVPNVYRAPLDNDMYIKKLWHIFELENIVVKGKTLTVRERSSGALRITAKQSIHAKGQFAVVHTHYDVQKNGVVKVRTVLSPRNLACSRIPRFGVSVELNESLANIKYYGRGENESMPDMKEQSVMGMYHTTVKDMHEPYIKPQDNGNRTGVHLLEMTDADGDGILFYSPKNSFVFNAHEYTQKTLQNATHQEDLKDEKTVFLSIDGHVRGTGSNSCGPEPLKEYIIYANKRPQFSFTIAPVKAKTE